MEKVKGGGKGKGPREVGASGRGERPLIWKGKQGGRPLPGKLGHQVEVEGL